VKAYNEFNNDPIKMCPKHKTKVKVDLKLKILKLCFYQVYYDLWWIFFFHELFFNVWACAYFLFPHCGLHSLIVLHNKWCSLHLIMWNKMIEKFNEPKKVGFSILLNVFLMYFSLWHKKFIDVCFDNLIKFFYFTLLYTTQRHMILTYLHFHKNVLSNMGIYLSINFLKKYFKPTYLSNYLKETK
jgi:hypothetical protein